VRVEHVPCEAVNDLRVAWHREDFPRQYPGPSLAQARELALRHDVQVLAAIDAAGDVRDLWIAADDEDRPKQLDTRLGFRPAWIAMEFLRLP
jgi:hypothetical protein